MTTRKPHPTDPADDRLLRYEEVAQLLNCSRKTVQRLVSDGELVPVNLSRIHNQHKMFRRSDIQAYIRNLPEAS
ncbi:helix-turn-helix domain-containing protein [Tsukamurella sp. USMM236]|uniref:helix-turn-helix domain-containing protein n=1 Tax=Tsukamurella sp. USMM236 TaxID=3081301 RepID=UPI00301A3808